MIIFGTRAVTRTVKEGHFHCPQCGCEKSYKHKAAKKHGHLYFIPLIPMGEAVEYIECQGCKETYRTDVLDAFDGPSNEEIKSEFDKAIKRLMIMMMMADGVIEDDEVEAIISIYGSVAGRVVSETEVRSEISVALAEQKDLMEYLAGIGMFINDHGKELLVRAALMVAVADNKFDESEMELTMKIAAALGMTASHVKGIFQDMSEQSA